MIEVVTETAEETIARLQRAWGKALGEADDMKASLTAADLRVKQLEAENRIAIEAVRSGESRIKELEDERHTVYCAFCGFLAERPSEPGEITVLMAAHIASCEKHPLNKAVRENDRLRKMGLALLEESRAPMMNAAMGLKQSIAERDEAADTFTAEYRRRKKEWES